MREQDALFGAVASDSTAFRVVDAIASTPGLLDAVADAHALARERVWALTGPPERVTIDVDATLLGSHSEKEGAAGNYKGGYGFHPLMAYCDETDEALAAILRPGNAGSNTAADHPEFRSWWAHEGCFRGISPVFSGFRDRWTSKSVGTRFGR